MARETTAGRYISPEPLRTWRLRKAVRALFARIRSELAALGSEVSRIPSYHKAAEQGMRSRRRQAQRGSRFFSDGDPALRHDA